MLMHMPLDHRNCKSYLFKSYCFNKHITNVLQNNREIVKLRARLVSNFLHENVLVRLSI